nr:hypothetical protein [Tanacetum cinerariifolium]
MEEEVDTMVARSRSSQSSPRSYTQEQVVRMTRQHQEEVGSSWYTPPPMYWPTPPTYGPPPPTYGPTPPRVPSPNLSSHSPSVNEGSTSINNVPAE